MIARLVAAVAAPLCLLAAAWLAWQHPLAPGVALAACAAVATLATLWPAGWPLLLLPLLPWIGLAPWTGWLVVEELDLAVLSIAAGGCLRLAFGWPAQSGATIDAGSLRERQPRRKPPGWPLGSLVPLMPLVLSTLIAALRGLADAGGLSWGWWQSYREPLNSLRLAKPMLDVLLLWPLAAACFRADAQAAQRRTGDALLLLLLGVGLIVCWERAAYPGLLNFSTDYRAVGPFWEMHVGGAALDAVLAMTLPFAAAACADARSPGRWALAAAALLSGAHAALATFSRIVYIAVPLGLTVWWWLRRRQRQAGPDVLPLASPAARGTLQLLVALAIFVPAAWELFPGSGYRGMLALLGAAALLLPLGAALRGLNLLSRLMGLIFGAAMAAALVALSPLVPKGAYLSYAAAWALTAVLVGLGRKLPGVAIAMFAGAGFIAMLGGLVSVCLTWGGSAAGWSALVVALALLALLGLAAGPAAPIRWPASLRWQAQVLGALGVAGLLIGVFGGGAYMGSRVSGSVSDVQVRQQHWMRALDLLTPGDWFAGKGLGRFVAARAFSGRAEDQTGDHRLEFAGAGHAVVLTSGGHEIGDGEIYRLNQRIERPAPGPLSLRFDARLDRAVVLRAEVCAKHLLYPFGCDTGQLEVPAQAGRWQPVAIQLGGDRLSAGPWYARRSTLFAIGLVSNSGRIEITRIRLTDSQGQELLANGDFEPGLAHWFFGSDRHHLPWHIKNMVLHLLFEQGLLGLGAFVLLAAVLLWKLSVGAARNQPMAPALAAAIVGLVTVGMVDSIFDMPRVAFLLLTLCMTGLLLPAEGAAGRMAGGR